MRRATTKTSVCVLWGANFYPRPPRGGRLLDADSDTFYIKISIHALREEGDFRHQHSPAFLMIFLSTPSARRATSYRMGSPFSLRDFYPRPPRGGRRPQVRRNLHRIKFLSTPSARRATDSRSDHDSIVRNFYPRPPRGGRPMPTMYCGWKRCYFYPRPPRGGRPLWGTKRQVMGDISIHALREEGDRASPVAFLSLLTFLSTSSARRATQ